MNNLSEPGGLISKNSNILIRNTEQVQALWLKTSLEKG